MSDDEFNLIKPLFVTILPTIIKKDLRLVDYCYCNCSEPDDCFDIEKDEITKEQIY